VFALENLGRVDIVQHNLVDLDEGGLGAAEDVEIDESAHRL
jgi:hypothetical protein